LAIQADFRHKICRDKIAAFGATGTMRSFDAALLQLFVKINNGRDGIGCLRLPGPAQLGGLIAPKWASRQEMHFARQKEPAVAAGDRSGPFVLGRARFRDQRVVKFLLRFGELNGIGRRPGRR
jgi:hypothetical protein